MTVYFPLASWSVEQLGWRYHGCKLQSCVFVKGILRIPWKKHIPGERPAIYILGSRSFFTTYRRTQSHFSFLTRIYMYIYVYVYKCTRTRYLIACEWIGPKRYSFYMRDRSDIIHTLHIARDLEITEGFRKVTLSRENIFGTDIRCISQRATRLGAIWYMPRYYSTLMHDVRDRRAKAESGWPTCKSLLPHDRDYFFPFFAT